MVKYAETIMNYLIYIYIYIYTSSCFHMFFVCCQEPCNSTGTSWFFHMMHALFIIPNSKLSGKYNFPACYIQKKNVQPISMFSTEYNALPDLCSASNES